MPDIQTIVDLLRSGTGRCIAAAIVFAALWALKAIPWVSDTLLTTPRRKQAAAVILALGPAAVLLADTSIPLVDVVATALGLALGAMGINTMRPSKSGPP